MSPDRTSEVFQGLPDEVLRNRKDYLQHVTSLRLPYPGSFHNLSYTHGVN